MKKPTSTPLSLLAHGRDISEAEAAAELAGGALGASGAILLGLIKAGIVDAKAMRAWLQSLVDELSPAERHLAYGFSLSQVIEMLDQTALQGVARSPAKPQH